MGTIYLKFRTHLLFEIDDLRYQLSKLGVLIKFLASAKHSLIFPEASKMNKVVTNYLSQSLTDCMVLVTLNPRYNVFFFK